MRFEPLPLQSENLEFDFFPAIVRSYKSHLILANVRVVALNLFVALIQITNFKHKIYPKLVPLKLQELLSRAILKDSVNRSKKY